MKKNLFLSNTQKTLEQTNTSSVLVGLSGGADSVALLLALVKILGKENVKALHVNHEIRGDEANRDEAFCVDLCSKLGVELKTVRFDIPALSKKEGLGLEECARNYRYTAFEQTAKELGLNTVATAHNANDNAEGIIFNLCRGSGINGLCGIPVQRMSGDIKIVRPVLWAKKDEILAFLSSLGQNYVTDSTNLCTDYTRNYIRAKIIPGLTSVNEGAIDNISSFCSILSDANDLISSMSEKFLSNALYPEGIRFEKEGFLSLHRAIGTRVIADCSEKIVGSSLSHGLIDTVYDFISSSEPGQKLNLSNSLDLFCEKSSVLFCKRILKKEYRHKLNKGLNDFEEYGFKIYLTDSSDKNFSRITKNIYTSFKLTILNTDMINGDIYIRNKTDSDKYAVNSISCKPKNLLNSKNIPHNLRQNYPVVCDDCGILCMPGFAPRDGCDGRKSEHQTIVIYIYNGQKFDL